MNARVYDFTPRTSPTAPADAETSAPVGRVVYTVKEVAGMLSLNLGGTYALIRSGEIPAIKLGGRWVVPRGRFHTWLETCHAEPESVSPVGLDPIEQAHAEVLAAITRRRSQRGA